jgi:hypothetical protein
MGAIIQEFKKTQPDPSLTGVWFVKLPGCYPPRGNPLPQRMARLVEPAANALALALKEINESGGTLYCSDCYRSTEDQAKAHMDYVTHRKSAYSPPAGGSMHEAARAIDIDVGNTLIGLAKTKVILRKYGWIGIADTGSECWHHDWRGVDGQDAYNHGGYRNMARVCIAMIHGAGSSKLTLEAAEHERSKEIQTLLNKALSKLTPLSVDGLFGDECKRRVFIFQKANGLAPDGIVGPLTLAALKKATGG